MTFQTPADVSASYFGALSQGDVPTAMSLLSPVGALLGGMMAASAGTFRLTVDGPAMVNGALVAVPVRFAGELPTVSMDMAGVDLLTVREGKIVEVHLFSEDGAAEDAFWGQG